VNLVRVAERLRGLEGSPTLVLAAKAKALADAGRPIADFTAGEPDLPTPAHIKEAATQAIAHNRTRYTPVAGIPELRAAIAQEVSRMSTAAVQAAQVLVSCGAKHGLFNAIQALCQAGDEVIVFCPYWVSYVPMIQLAGAKAVIIETTERDGYVPHPDALSAALTARTRAIVLNSPGNPTGAVMTRDALAAIGERLAGREVAVISDEIYDALVYPPARHVSILEAAPQLAEQTILVGGVSKTYSMTGWRIGYAVGPKPWIEAMTTIQSHSTSNPASISQYAALAALQGDRQPVARMREEYQRRRDRLVAGLKQMAGLRPFAPDGAFYVWCDVSGLGQPAQATAAQWLEHADVAVVPGEGFGSTRHVRFSYATAMDVIERGLTQLASCVAKQGKGACRTA
jgi:aspartate aminotransferase